MQHFTIFDGSEPQPEPKEYSYPSDCLDFFAINVGGQTKFGSTPHVDAERIVVCLGAL